MEYREFHPSGDTLKEARDDQLRMALGYFHPLKFALLRQLTLFCAGMGSGKTNLMTCLLTNLTSIKRIAYVLSPDEGLGEQMKMVFKRNSSFTIIDGTHVRAGNEIEGALARDSEAVVFFNHISSSKGSFGPAGIALIRLLNRFKDHCQLALIDELDKQLTSLTGGINAKVEHSKTPISEYGRVVDQDTKSLNIFDAFRSYRVKCICFSGTMNNLVSSKLPSLGYSNDDITILNFSPIKQLYENTKIVSTRMELRAILPYLSTIEGKQNEKILISLPTRKDLEDLVVEYEKIRPLSYVRITGDAGGDNYKPNYKEKLTAAKYILAINLATIGFDISTHAPGYEITMCVLFRKMSDKGSQPLSKNPSHNLHHEASSSFLQICARMREGGLVLVPSSYTVGNTMHELMVEVFDVIRNGQHQFSYVGPPRKIQSERINQGILLGLIQNFRPDNRPVVAEALEDLLAFDGRDLEKEFNQGPLDCEYWIKTVGSLWKVYRERFENGLTHEEFSVQKPSMIAKYRSAIVQRGTGYKEGREVNLVVEEQVKTRAQNICAHCGDIVKDFEGGQVCHVERKDNNGSYTLDNLVWGHKGCDSSYDNEHQYIHVPDGGYYLAKKRRADEPDMKQWSQISVENIRKRWNWAMNTMGFSNKNEFKAKLGEWGYTHFP